MSEMPVVLFLCTHNAGRSLAARVLLDHYASGRVDVRSAGSEPGREAQPLRRRDPRRARPRSRKGVPEAAHRRDSPSGGRHRHHGLWRRLSVVPRQALP